MNMADADALMALRGRWMHDEPMAKHVSWRAGGRARRAYVPADLDDVVQMLPLLPPDEDVMFVGLGSNLLIRDGGYAGTIVFIHNALRTLAMVTDGVIHADAGVASPKVARFAALHDRIGAEFLAGIPGTVGGALAMNAGCYGGETWRVVREVTTIARDGTLRTRVPADYHIDYRHVIPAFAAAQQEWFVSARFEFPAGSGSEARVRIRDFLARRIATQPLEKPNAGSVFRNPTGEFAARLIEACGLKGRRIGHAVISEKHANFIVNLGGASAQDIESLIREAQDQVHARFGIALECEVRIVGDKP